MRDYPSQAEIQRFLSTSSGRKCFGQFLSLLRGVDFIDRAKTEDDVRRQSAAGYVEANQFGIPIFGTHYLSINLGWKKQSLDAAEFIVQMLISVFPDLREGDVKTLISELKAAVKDSLLVSSIFDISKHSNTNLSLFSILSNSNPTQPVQALLEIAIQRMQRSIANWIIMFPLPRLKSPTCFVFPRDGITLCSPYESGLWDNITSSYSGVARWRDEMNDHLKRRWETLDTSWLICQTNGTVSGGRKNAERRMRKFIAILFATLYPEPGLLVKSSAQSETYCVQFPLLENSTGYSEYNAAIGNIFPPLICEQVATESSLRLVSDWYRRESKLPPSEQRRRETASQFINFGIVADDIERFIHFFIALDAIFGVRHRVEATITDGVTKLFPNDPIWKYKIGKLFKLRSDIVHGGCSSIEDWEDHGAYRRHTGSDPMHDVAQAAFKALTAA